VSETAILFLEFIFLPSRYEVFVSTKDAASDIFLPDMQKGEEEYRISVKLLRSD
jgi:hypothetical protein